MSYAPTRPRPDQRRRPPTTRRAAVDQHRRPGDFIAVHRGLAPYFDGIDTDPTTPIGVFDTHTVSDYLSCTTTAAVLATLLGR